MSSERATTDIEEAAVSQRGAVHDAKETAERLVVAGEDPDADPGLFANAFDELVGVGGAAERFGADGDGHGGAEGGGNLRHDGEGAEPPVDAPGSEVAALLALAQARIEALLIDDLECQRREGAGDQEANGVRADIDDGDCPGVAHTDLRIEPL
ncbi:MAG: hypothetical protein M5U18_18325 [Dehalococcoidia bacterium]|nr:hypothetical protein [Dehalococcoidia bacterium]